MDPILSEAQLEEIRRFPTPTVSNAIEVFDLRPRNEGFLPHYIRALMPDLPAIIGYAVTATTAAAPPTDEVPKLLNDYLRYVAHHRGPKIAVGQDLDDPPGLGADAPVIGNPHRPSVRSRRCSSERNPLPPRPRVRGRTRLGRAEANWGDDAGAE